MGFFGERLRDGIGKRRRFVHGVDVAYYVEDGDFLQLLADGGCYLEVYIIAEVLGIDDTYIEKGYSMGRREKKESRSI